MGLLTRSTRRSIRSIGCGFCCCYRQPACSPVFWGFGSSLTLLALPKCRSQSNEAWLAPLAVQLTCGALASAMGVAAGLHFYSSRSQIEAYALGRAWALGLLVGFFAALTYPGAALVK